MLKRYYRLSKEKDIKLITKQGRNFFTPYFVVKFLTKTNPSPRFVVIVSTKVSKKAVRRNRLKRIVRETLRTHITEFVPGDYAIVMRPASEKLDNQTLVKSLIELLIKVKLLTPKKV